MIDNYCAFQLEGRLSPGVKAALEPALFSILDGMGMGVMRMLNSALGEGERAVWKGLYEDWKRERG